MADIICEEKELIRVYRAHFGTVTRRSKSVLRCSATAEDVAQEAFLRWMSKLRSLGGGAEQHLGLLYRIARGISIDALRRQGIAKRVMDSLPAGQMSDPSSERIYIALEDARRVDIALAELPEKARAAFLLRRLEAMSFRDIGKELGVSTTRAHQLALDAMIEIAEALEDEPSGD
ncbi:MAG: RNA polymerase sigma factor [Pseudomonadota bacterium]